MPIVSLFLGVIVRIYNDDHAPPHLHVQYGEHEAVLRVDTGKLLAGGLPNRVLRLVRQWQLKNKPALLSAWADAQALRPVKRIPGWED